MPKVSAAHRAARREQITAAALACFAEKGFQRTSMADIIAASGLSSGAIYLHFESKQQIVLAVGRRVLGRRLGDLKPTPGDRLGDPISALQHLLAGVADDIPDTRLPLQLWAEATVDPELGSLVTEIFATLRAALTGYLVAWADRHGAAEPAAWAETAFPAVLAFAQGFIVQRALLPDFDADAYFAAARAIAGPALLSPGRFSPAP